MRQNEADRVIDSWLEESGPYNTEMCRGIRFARTVYSLVINDLNSIISDLKEEEPETVPEDGQETVEEKPGETAEDKPKEKAEDKAEDKQEDKAAGAKPKRKASEHRVKKCAMCGAEFKPRSGVAKYCENCRADKKREQNKFCERNRRAKKQSEKPKEDSDIAVEELDADAITEEVSLREAFARELAAME